MWAASWVRYAARASDSHCRQKSTDEATLSTEASSKPLYRAATRASLLGLAVNLALGVVKLVGGILGNSFALLSDAVNSLGDSLSSIVMVSVS